MAEFSYRGVDKTGKKVQGKLTAPSEGDVRMILRAQGVRPTTIGKVSVANRDLGSLLKRQQSASVETLMTFTRQLNVLISSGIPLVQSLETLSEQGKSASFRAIVLLVKEKVSQGSYLWEAMAQYPKIFPKLYVSLVRAGEASGSLDAMLNRLGRYLENSHRLQKMITGAMFYPIMVVGIGAMVIGAMLIFVIPKFEELLTSSGQELPLPTKIVIQASHMIADNLIQIGGVVGILTFLTLKYLNSDEGKGVIDRIMFRAPLFGNLMQKGSCARFARTLQTLLIAGINLIDAMDICKATVGNSIVEGAIARTRAEVETGKGLSASMAKQDVFPMMAVQMIGIGESTGNLDKMLEKIADLYEEEVEMMVAGMSKMIEPFILVFLGGTVGGMLIAMYLPIFKIAGSAE